MFLEQPPELIQNMWSFLGNNDIISLLKTCKYLNYLGKTRAWLSTITLKYGKKQPDLITLQLQHKKSIQKIVIDDGHFDLNFLIMELPKTIIFEVNYLENFYLINSKPHVATEKLYISSPIENNKMGTGAHIAIDMSNFPNLKVLYLEARSIMLVNINKCTKLEYLCVRSHPNWIFPINRIVDVLEELPNLKLVIHQSNYIDQDFSHVREKNKYGTKIICYDGKQFKDVSTPEMPNYGCNWYIVRRPVTDQFN